MTPSSAAILERLEITIGRGGEPRPLVDAIETELRLHFSLSTVEAAARAERLLPPVARRIAETAAASDARGVRAILVLIGSANTIVAGQSYVLPEDEDHVAEAKTHRLHVDELLEAIKNLTPPDFEAFGAAVLIELGAENPKVTPQSGDEGIDFYGRMSLGRVQILPEPFVKMAHDSVVFFAGQAKRYKHPVGPEVVRELVGAIELARSKTFSAATDDMFEGIDFKILSPLLALLFTTGELTSGATRLAEAAGVVARSGEQLATFLADRGVGMVRTGDATSFDHGAFMSWLKPHRRAAANDEAGET